jgi:receptor protein-tyrosine kinase
MGKLDKTLAKKRGDKEQSNVPVDDEIDVRLDQDMSDLAIPPKKSIYKEIDLDIDLTGPFGVGDEFTEPKVLDINPLRPFSRQVDINLGRLNRKGYISPEQANSPLSTTFRRIKRPLLNNVLGKGATVIDNANLIMIASSLSGEGKTFTAINLALSMAMEKDKNILLVDADVSKPSHHEILGIESEVGFIDFLTGKVRDISKIINKTNIPSLSLMFAGSKTPHAIEIFASEAMGRFLAELSNRYSDRVIIFDSAPLLLPTEASVLASHMGQVVVVVEAEITDQKLVKQAVEMLDNRIVLLVLNKVRQESDFGAYGYYGYDED